MILKVFKKNKIKKVTSFVEADEIFMDSKNIENFDNQQFEGRIEMQISKKTVALLGIFFVILFISFSTRLGLLQIGEGETYLKRSQNNTLEKQIIFADRGIIYDRNKVDLAWNEKDSLKLEDDSNLSNKPEDKLQEQDFSFSTRKYKLPGFSHILGYVSYPTKDKSGNYWQTEFIGKDGLEEQYNDKLKGQNGSRVVEVDASKKVLSKNPVTNAPVQGPDLVTTIDSRIQSQIFSYIKKLSDEKTFSGGAAVIIDVNAGEIITSTSYPEYNSELLSLGKDVATIRNYSTDKRKVYLDRTISGLYTPGSIVKPFFAIGALNEKIISPDKKILSTGSISIPNPYFPGQETVFKDWKANGWVNMMQAIATSCDVYFYEIGGGYQGQKGLGIENLGKYAKLFGIGQKTGVDLPGEKGGTIPGIEWKKENFPGDPWRVGDTYHTAIGQYGFQVTPMEMVRAVSSIANSGTLVSPHFILGDLVKESEKTDLGLDKNYFSIVRQGMHLGASPGGTAQALSVPYVKLGAKTGTAQLGVLKNKVNSWVMGFFPYENPKYAFAVMMEAGPSTNTIGAASVMRQTLDWMSTNVPEYFKQ